MSTKVTGLVWDLDLPRDEKYILLAYADHADHDGCNIFPAVATIVKKTGYSERSVQTITKTLEKDGWLISDGQGPNRTNKWHFPIDRAQNLRPPRVQNDAGEGAEKRVKRVQKNADEGAEKRVKRVQKNADEGAVAIAPESSLLRTEPSERESATPNFENMTVPEARRVPEIRMYEKATDFFPGSVIWATVVERIKKSGVTEKTLHEAAVAWQLNGYKSENVGGILDWAINGIPENRRNAAPPVSKQVHLPQPSLMCEKAPRLKDKAERSGAIFDIADYHNHLRTCPECSSGLSAPAVIVELGEKLRVK